MNKKILSVVALCLYQTNWANNRINLYVRNYPLTEQRAQKVMNKMQRPEKMARYTLNSILNHESNIGIFCTYGGFLDATDVNGYIAFPRKHIDPELLLVVTPQIEPEMMFGSTVHHWKLVNNQPQSFFSIKREYDEETKTYFWNTTQTDKPENNRLPHKALVIFAKPKHVFVPEGITITSDRENLTLPYVYMKKGVHVMDNALFILSIAHLLRPIDILYKPDKKRYQDHLIG